MPAVGGFPGSGVSVVPAGKIQLFLQWNTDDRLHLQCQFVITGLTDPSFSQTVDSDEYGNAAVFLPTGDYTIEPIYEGNYVNTGPRSVSGQDSCSYLLLWDAFSFNRVADSTLTFEESRPAATYVIVNAENGYTVASGTVGGTIPINRGTYNITITERAHSWTSQIEVDGETILSGYSGGILYTGSAMTIASFVTDGATFGPDDTLLISETPYDLDITFSQQWASGNPVKASCELTISSPGFTNVPELDYSLPYKITSGSNLSRTLPAVGKYRVSAAGGGGGGGGGGAAGGYISSSTNLAGVRGGGAGNGGRGAEYVVFESTVTSLDYVVTIGTGGSGGKGGTASSTSNVKGGDGGYGSDGTSTVISGAFSIALEGGSGSGGGIGKKNTGGGGALGGNGGVGGSGGSGVVLGRTFTGGSGGDNGSTSSGTGLGEPGVSANVSPAEFAGSGDGGDGGDIGKSSGSDGEESASRSSGGGGGMGLVWNGLTYGYGGTGGSGGGGSSSYINKTFTAQNGSSGSKGGNGVVIIEAVL